MFLCTLFPLKDKCCVQICCREKGQRGWNKHTHTHKEKTTKQKSALTLNPQDRLSDFLYFHPRSHKTADNAAVSFVFSHPLYAAFDITDVFISSAGECARFSFFYLEKSAIFSVLKFSVCRRRDEATLQKT